MGLNGTVVGFSENYAFLDCGVLRDPREGQRPSRRPLVGKLYRLDLLERFALSPKLVGPKTEAVIKHGMSMQVRAAEGGFHSFRLGVGRYVAHEPLKHGARSLALMSRPLLTAGRCT
jgi:hypothetical protein